MLAMNIPFLGDLVKAGANLVGGLIGQNEADNANRRNWELNAQLQKEFAQNSVRWRVEDAKAAGIHPIYAMGAPTMSPAVSVGSSAGPGILASSIGAMGQDIGRAINATRTGEERQDAFSQTVRELELQNFTLRNDLLAAQIAKLRAGSNPPMPGSTDDYQRDQSSLGRDKEKPVTPLVIGNTRIVQDRGISDANEFEQRYGETMSDWVFGPYIAWRDFNTHVLQPMSDRFERRRKVWHGRVNPEFEERR